MNQTDLRKRAKDFALRVIRLYSALHPSSCGAVMFELKTLTREAIPAALEKAVRYRLLNEPEQAESICEDVLRIDPENQEALATLVLALTDRLYGPRPASPHAAREL